MVTEPWEEPLLFCGGGFHSPAQTTLKGGPRLETHQAENKKPKSGDQPSAKGVTEQSGEEKGEEKRFLTHWIA